MKAPREVLPDAWESGLVEAAEVAGSAGVLLTLARSMKKLAEADNAFAFLVDRETGRLDQDLLAGGPWRARAEFARLRGHLERNPGVLRTLLRGEHATLPEVDSDTEEHVSTANAVDSGTRTPSLVIFPVIHRGSLEAIAGLRPRDEGAATPQRIEIVRGILARTAPTLARVRDLEDDRGHQVEPIKVCELTDAATEMKTRLISSIAHELRATLVGVRGYTNTVLKERTGAINEAQRESLKIVLKNADKLVNLTNWAEELLRNSVEPLSLETFNVRELLEECMHHIQGVAAEKGLKVVERAPLASFMIVGNREKLALALNIFFECTTRAADPGTTVEIELSKNGSKQAVFRICYAGSGECAEAFREILENYSGPIPGRAVCGQGSFEKELPVARDLINLHGGRIILETGAACGSRFVFTLPVIDSRE